MTFGNDLFRNLSHASANPAKKELHNGIRDWVADTCQVCTGAATSTEQRVPGRNKLNPRTGQVEEAILDVATRDVFTGAPKYLDVAVGCEHDEDFARLPRERLAAQAAGQQAAAAAAAVPGGAATSDKALRAFEHMPSGSGPAAGAGATMSHPMQQTQDQSRMALEKCARA